MTPDPAPDETERNPEADAADQLTRDGQDMRLDAECTCTPLPDAEGSCAWCDVHGQPSVAFEQGVAEGENSGRVFERELRDLRTKFAAMRRDRDRLSDELETQTGETLDREQRIGHMREEIDRLRAQRDRHSARVRAQDAELAELKELCEDCETRMQHAVHDLHVEMHPDGGRGCAGCRQTVLLVAEALNYREGHGLPPMGPRPGPVPTPVPEQGREVLVDALDGALVELKRLRFSVKAKHIPYPEELDEEIDRVQAVLLTVENSTPADRGPLTPHPPPWPVDEP